MLPPMLVPDAAPIANTFLESLQSVMSRPEAIRPTLNPEAIKYILAADSVSGHVLVCSAASEVQWIPYLYLRWACNALSNKKWLDRHVANVVGRPIPPQFDSLPRVPITQLHRILLIHYIPRLNDGTLAGMHERIIYRLRTRWRDGTAAIVFEPRSGWRDWRIAASSTHPDVADRCPSRTFRVR